MFPPSLQDVCHTLRTVHEDQLGRHLPLIGPKIQAVLGDPQLIQRLAQQPFVGIQTLLDKCAILEHEDDSPLLREFRHALEAAGALQSHATEALRQELLMGTVERKHLRPVLMMALSRQATALPNENLGTNRQHIDVTKAKRAAMGKQLQLLLMNALNAANHRDSGWEIAVLRQLLRQLNG